MDDAELEQMLEAPVDKKAPEEKKAKDDAEGDDKGDKAKTNGDDKSGSDKKARSRSRSRDRRSRRSRRSRSRSRDRSDRGRRRSRSRSGDRRRRKSPSRTPSAEREAREKQREMLELTRDVRTVFMSQLQVRATTKDVKRFCKKAGGFKVKDIQLIKDKFTGRSKGFAYIELKSLEDVPKALMLSGQRFMFKNGKQGFPVLVKASEAEKNYAHALDKQAGGDAAAAGGANALAEGSKTLVVSNLLTAIQEMDLRPVFEPFGELEAVAIEKGPDGVSRGRAVVKYRQPGSAAQAVQNLNGLDLVGQKISVAFKEVPAGQGAGPTNAFNNSANYNPGALASNPAPSFGGQVIPGMITGVSIPSGYNVPADNTLVMGGMGAMGAAAAQPAVGMGMPSQCLVIKNMFNPAEESEPGWDKDIKEDVSGECEKFGKVLHAFVDKNSAGFVYMMFDSAGAGAGAANSLNGRWFAAKRITVQYMPLAQYTNKFPEAAGAQ